MLLKHFLSSTFIPFPTYPEEKVKSVHILPEMEGKHLLQNDEVTPEIRINEVELSRRLSL